MRPLSIALSLLIIGNPVLLAEDGPTPIQKQESAQITWKNVELSKTGEMHGQLMDEAGRPLARREVRVMQQNKTQTVLTDDQGRFVCGKLTSGACAVEHGNNGYALRIWRHGIAPPKSLQSFALIAGQGDVARGNMSLPLPFPIPLPPIILPAFPHGGGLHGGFAGGGFAGGGFAGGSIGTTILAAGAIAGGFVAISEAQGDDDDAS